MGLRDGQAAGEIPCQGQQRHPGAGGDHPDRIQKGPRHGGIKAEGRNPQLLEGDKGGEDIPASEKILPFPGDLHGDIDRQFRRPRPQHPGPGLQKVPRPVD